MKELIFYEFAATAPFHLFAYVPFFSHLRFSKKRLAALLLLSEAAYLGMLFLLMKAGIPYAQAKLVSVPLFAGLMFRSVKMEPGKIAFLYIFTMDYIMMIRGISSFLTQTWLLPSSGFFSWQEGVVNLGLFFVTFPFMMWYLLRTARMVFEMDVPRVWRVAWILPLFTSLIVLFYTYFPGGQVDLIFLFSRTALMGCMFLIYFFIIRFMDHFREQAAALEHIRQLERLTMVQADQYALIQSHFEEMRRVRHDLRQHLNVIQTCIANGNISELNSYVEAYRTSIPQDAIRPFTRNYAVDAVLHFYASKAMTNGIDMVISFQIDAKLPIPEPEFCVLLGNLLENALENCSPKNGKRFIHVNARKKGSSMLYLTVDNSCGQQPVMEGERFCSGKHEGFGIGTESVRMIAERYHGEARFEWKDEVFYASVMVNP